MSARLFEITARSKMTFDFCKMADFTFGPGQDVAAELAISSPDWTLYCLDFTEDKALFVELPPGSNLDKPVFIHEMQFQEGRRAIAVPLDDLEALASKLPPLPKLAFLFNIGRCGSTLAGRILAQLPGVWSLSEPDCYTNLAMARRTVPPERAKALIAASTRLMCRPPLGVDVDTVVIKLRSEPIMIAELVVQALPEARYLFLYRDAEGYVNSLGKFVQRIMGEQYIVPESWRVVWHIISINGPLSLLDHYFDKPASQLLPAEIHTMTWLIRMDGYLAALGHGVSFQALHYRDLNSDRRLSTARLLEGCGISTEYLDLALNGFDKDAHAGSTSDNTHQAKSLTDDDRMVIRAMLKRLGKPDYLALRVPSSLPPV